MVLAYLTGTRDIHLYTFSVGAFIIGRKMPIFLRFTARWEIKLKLIVLIIDIHEFFNVQIYYVKSFQYA